MKVCPNCGYKDHSSWRQNRWRPNVEFIQLDLFGETEDKNMLTQLLQGQITTDKHYAYQLSGHSKGTPQKVIERILIEEYNATGKQAFSIPREHHPHWTKNTPSI